MNEAANTASVTVLCIRVYFFEGWSIVSTHDIR
jgi:hypothetical protein